MSAYKQVLIEEEMKAFAARNFEIPSICRNLEQVRFYSAELCLKITEFERRFNFVPAWAYVLLEQYTIRLHSFDESGQALTSH